MIKPLYLDAALQWQVTLDDGPALNISAPGRARSLFPLQRLARVVSPSHAQWTSAALLACLRAGVTVVFTDANGQTVGWCFGPRRRETTLACLLREALSLPHGAELLADWQRAQERRDMLATLHHLQVSSRELTVIAVRARLCNLHRQRLSQPAGLWLRALQGLTEAWVAERLHDLIGDPALIGFACEGVHLSRLLNGLMEWTLHRMLQNLPLAFFDKLTPARLAATAVELQGASLHNALGNLVGSLEQYLRAELT